MSDWPANPAGLADAIIALSPASYWKLDEASGTTAADQMGAIAGTYGGVTPTLGMRGPRLADSSVDLLSDTAKVTFGDVYDFAGTASFTALIVYKPPASRGAGNYRLFAKEGEWGIFAVYDASADPQVETFRWASPTNAVATARAKAGEWHVAAITFEPSTLGCYSDGELVRVADASSVTNGTNTLRINGTPTDTGSPHIRAAHAAIFNRALTQSELDSIAAQL